LPSSSQAQIRSENPKKPHRKTSLRPTLISHTQPLPRFFPSSHIRDNVSTIPEASIGRAVIPIFFGSKPLPSLKKNIDQGGTTRYISLTFCSFLRLGLRRAPLSPRVRGIFCFGIGPRDSTPWQEPPGAGSAQPVNTPGIRDALPGLCLLGAGGLAGQGRPGCALNQVGGGWRIEKPSSRLRDAPDPGRL